MKIEISDIPENLHNMLDIVGEDAFVEISKLYGGDVVYVPTYKSIIRASRNREIVRKFDGFNASKLAREYGISLNHLKRILSGSGM